MDPAGLHQRDRDREKSWEPEARVRNQERQRKKVVWSAKLPPDGIIPHVFDDRGSRPRPSSLAVSLCDLDVPVP